MTTMNERFEGAAAKVIGTTPEDVRSSVSSMASAASEEISHVAGQAQQVAHQQLDRLADTIRRKPIQSTGIAAGIGFLLAMLARR
jgi:ElaB/YqjD/DUF883 family membrane-anchored ribosome-binding protein